MEQVASPRLSPSDSLVHRSGHALLALTRLLPRRQALRLCRAFGRLWVRVGGPRVAVAATNLAIAFPDQSDAVRRRMLGDAFASMAELLVDVAAIAGLEEATARHLVRFEGFEHIESALAEGRGVILLTAHFGSFDLFAAACAARGLPVSVVYRERRNAGLERLISEWRARAGIETLARGSAARGVLRALRKGRIVAMLLDQNTPRNEGVFVSFFGRPACTRSAPARLAMRTGSPVVPGFLFRSEDGLTHVARFGPAIEMLPAGDPPEPAVQENVQRMTAAIEAAIRAAPEHWSWIHRRWRTGPERGVNVYEASPRQGSADPKAST